MKDEDIERLLANARPIGPPVQLRARIVSRRPKRAWPWAVAAAALLALTILLQGGAGGARESVRATTTDALRDPEVELTAALREAGGLSEDEARLMAMAGQMAMRIDRNRPEAEGREP